MDDIFRENNLASARTKYSPHRLGRAPRQFFALEASSLCLIFVRGWRVVSWKNAIHMAVGSSVTSRLHPPTGRYTRVFPLWYARRARVRATIVTLTFCEGGGKTRRVKNLLFTYEEERAERGKGDVRRVDSTTRYPRAIRRNSATRLSDPHDLTYTEGATEALQRWLYTSQTRNGDRSCRRTGNKALSRENCANIYVNHVI